MIEFNGVQICRSLRPAASVIPAWALGIFLALAAHAAQAQSGFAQLDVDIQKTAISALTEIETKYYKTVSRTALLDACAKGVVDAKSHPQSEHPDDEGIDHCLRSMISKLGTGEKYVNLQEAKASHKRKRDTVAPVSNAVLAGNVMLIRIPAFSDSTPLQIADALDAAMTSKSRGLIIDLRGNNDDHFIVTAILATAFLPSGTRLAIAQFGKTGTSEELNVNAKMWAQNAGVPAKLPGIALTVPLVVLVDEKTGGTREVLAAALQDQRRALLVGRQTAGHTLFRFSASVTYGGFFSLTQGAVARANGVAIDGQGVTPDRIVPAEKDIETALGLLQ